MPLQLFNAVTGTFFHIQQTLPGQGFYIYVTTVDI